MIRNATVADVDALLRLEKIAFPGDRISRRSFRHLLSRGHARLLVDATEHGLCGYVLLLFRRGLSLARLYSIAVDPGCRGQGVAQSLVKAAEQAALDEACVLMRLEVRSDNTASQRLFTGLGYRAFGVHPAYYEDAADAVRFEKRLIPELRPALKPLAFYRQTLDFTCGPASLMMAMHALDPDLRLDRRLELRLWREATTVFMTSGHGGSSPHGLALAACRRGFRCEILLRNPGPLFVESVRSPDKREVLELVEQDFMDRVAEAGIPQRFGGIDMAVLEEAFDRGGVPLVLISSYRLYREKAPHWVVLSGLDERFCYITDPYVDEEHGRSAADCLHSPLPRTEFERMARYGRTGQQAAVVVYR